MPRRALLVLSLLALPGCIFQALSPERQLTDQVHALNDEARWARIDLASERVSPEYRETFLLSHAAWGGDVQIADADLTNVTLAAGNGSATSRVSMSWYDQRTLLVSSSVLVQEWTFTENGFLLAGESIVAGDERLLDLPQEAAEEGDEETSGGEAPVASL